MSNKIKCPRCGKEDFLIKTEMDLEINPGSNFGKVKYGWITKVRCANIECGFDLTDEEGIGTEILVGIAKTILSASSQETLLIK